MATACSLSVICPYRPIHSFSYEPPEPNTSTASPLPSPSGYDITDFQLHFAFTAKPFYLFTHQWHDHIHATSDCNSFSLTNSYYITRTTNSRTCAVSAPNITSMDASPHGTHHNCSNHSHTSPMNNYNPFLPIPCHHTCDEPIHGLSKTIPYTTRSGLPQTEEVMEKGPCSD